MEVGVKIVVEDDKIKIKNIEGYDIEEQKITGRQAEERETISVHLILGKDLE